MPLLHVLSCPMRSAGATRARSFLAAIVLI
jgi:hypothetical protein